MWEQVKRVLKPRGVFVTTSSQPFTSALVMSNIKLFKYTLVWDKGSTADFLLAKHQPLKYHEDICVFGNGGVTYNPQMWQGPPNHQRKEGSVHFSNHTGQSIRALPANLDGMKYPRSILAFIKHTSKEVLHPAQKPVALLVYLIKTYTNPGDLVLDFCCGSGTTLVAAKQEGRHYIGIEKDAGYVEIARRRLGAILL